MRSRNIRVAVTRNPTDMSVSSRSLLLGLQIGQALGRPIGRGFERAQDRQWALEDQQTEEQQRLEDFARKMKLEQALGKTGGFSFPEMNRAEGDRPASIEGLPADPDKEPQQLSVISPGVLQDPSMTQAFQKMKATREMDEDIAGLRRKLDVQDEFGKKKFDYESGVTFQNEINEAMTKAQIARETGDHNASRQYETEVKILQEKARLFPHLAKSGTSSGSGSATGGSPKAPTESMQKAGTYGNRLQSAEKDFLEIEKSGFSKSTINPLKTGGMGNLFNLNPASRLIPEDVKNLANSPARQRFQQAERNFINATLRRESGAVISESEFKEARLQYIPQTGDSQEVLEQKARNRATVRKAFLDEGLGKTVAKPEQEEAPQVSEDDPLGLFK